MSKRFENFPAYNISQLLITCKFQLDRMSPEKLLNIQCFVSKTYETYQNRMSLISNMNFKNPYLYMFLIDLHDLFFVLFARSAVVMYFFGFVELKGNSYYTWQQMHRISISIIMSHGHLHSVVAIA